MKGEIICCPNAGRRVDKQTDHEVGKVKQADLLQYINKTNSQQTEWVSVRGKVRHEELYALIMLVEEENNWMPLGTVQLLFLFYEKRFKRVGDTLSELYIISHEFHKKKLS